jgi:ABC-type multidrug transport system fused ATPase/permease subunit
MSFFKRILFSDANNLIRIARERPIESTDQIPLPDFLSVYSKKNKSKLFDETKVDWSSGRTIYFSHFKAAKHIMYSSVVLQIFASLFSFLTPILMNQFMNRIQAIGSSNLWFMLVLAIGFGVSGAGQGIFIQHYFFKTLHFFQLTTNSVNKKIFEHSLKISNAAKQKYQIGDIVNFMSSDADAIGDAAITTIDLSNAILLLIGCSGLLFYYIGLSAFPALIVMAILVPLTQQLAKKFMHLEEEMMAHRDRRMTLMTQILNAIRVVKYFSWEKSIQNEVSQVRDLEIKSRTELAKSEIKWGLIYASISTVVLFTALFTHYLRGYEISLPIVFTCISIFSLMESQFGGLSRFISRFINIFVSGDRISAFLKSEQLTENMNISKNTENLHIQNLNFNFGDHVIFKNLNLNITKGESIAIVGGVGSGKSTLLNLLLSEYQPESGQILNAWSKSYVSQEAYIINSTLRENLIFGQTEVSEAQLQLALRLTCLHADIAVLPAGLNTEIGEKGVNLSGGQKQRVSLARAVLANSDFILLDDPLSAVDPRTEDFLCQNLIFEYWKNKTLICATHRITYLNRFDRILFLTENNNYQCGTYGELLASSTEFKKFIDLELKNRTAEIRIQEQTASVKENTLEVTESRVTVDEDREVGSVKGTIYGDYLRALGGYSKHSSWILFGLFFSSILFVMVPLAQRAWLTQAGKDVVSAESLILIYGALGLFTLLVVYVNNMLWAFRGIRAGQLFHDKILSATLKSEIRFFDSTPVGRILQRFSRDVESVDIHLQWSFDAAIHTLLNVVMSLCLIVFVLPISILFLGPILFFYYLIQNDYRRVAREVKRFDSVARSPRYSHFKETLQGLSVIRAFKQQSWFENEFLQKLEVSTQAFYTHYFVNRWFSTRLPLIGALISTLTIGAIILAAQQLWISAGLAGLITLYALEFWKHLNWGVRIFSDLESRMTSVERLSFYGNLPAEKEFIENSAMMDSGSLTFKNVKLRYAEHLPYVLKDVSFHIPSGARAGIIGRTGSGKSTLFQAVYRFVHFDEGDILIDGKSIRSFSLEHLRKNLSVIPQDPSLFMGTLRSNLDRYQEKSDEEIWQTLEKVDLADFIRKLPDQLNSKVTENGSNLSQGQRQLICLARALLMKVKIIFLDEATASVDLETDRIVQKVIRESLGGITLVTIAHRLSTLEGYDMIIELQKGQVASFSELQLT